MAVSWLTGHLDRWGLPLLVAVRWLPGGGTVAAPLAGSLRLRPKRFTPASVLGATLWSAYAVLIGGIGDSIADDPVVGLLISLTITVALGLVVTVAVRRADHRPVHAAARAW
jgi:membrane protein DedA with SNARE-associated domain